jgi:concanavalin A-like lectin/glucanase superfamily protein
MLSAIFLFPRNFIVPAPPSVAENSSVIYKPNHYIFFDGNASYGIIQTNQHSNVPLFSIAFWIKREGPNHSIDRPLEMFGIFRHGAGGRQLIPGGWQFDTGKVEKIGNDKLLFIISNSQAHRIATKPITIPNNFWTNVAATFDGRSIKIFMNGALENSLPFFSSFNPPPVTTPILLAGSGFPKEHWKGDLSNIQFYSRPLEQSEIISIYRGHVPQNGLIGLWKLDEGSGSIISDSSRHGNKGFIYNAIWR